MKEEKNRGSISKKHIQIISICVLAVFLIVATLLCIPLIKDLRTEEGVEKLKERLDSYSGVVGVLIFTFIQALQVVIAIVPPIQLIGGVLFGWFFGAVLSYAGVLLGTFVIFLLVSKFGRPLVEALVDEKLMKRFGFLQDEKKLVKILMILYIIPGIVPKDVISYLVPLTKVTKRDFFIYVMPCRLPAILLSTVLGSNVAGGNIRITVIVLAVCIVLGVIGFVLKEPILNRFGRHKQKP